MKNRFSHALFDFDGTISLIRSGWQDIMIPYFTDELRACNTGESDAALTFLVREFVDRLTGKQTIYQCMALQDEVTARGGNALPPQEYKKEYLRRLSIHTADRLRALQNGADRQPYMVKGALEFLQALSGMGVRCLLASGTDETDVRREAELLGVDVFFDGIYGANDQISLQCSKEAVIENLLREAHIAPSSLITFGDGYVEIELTKNTGGYAVGVATDETGAGGLDEWKRDRLLSAGANEIIPDFSDLSALCALVEGQK